MSYAVFEIKRAVMEDVEEIWRMCMELATYESRQHETTISEEDLRRNGFGENPIFQCVVVKMAPKHGSSGKPATVGYSLYFYSYDTINGRSITMDSIYVMPEFRNNGIGKALLKRVAETAAQNNCSSVCFYVYNRNKSAMAFYQSIGAQDVTISQKINCYVLDGGAMEALIKSPRGSGSSSQASPVFMTPVDEHPILLCGPSPC
ncbi:thialysine N-epsilon-acetyltransferase-like isoform X2 [Lethenteron reissneri]|uniref:thialysine N-epsilon-acetyltransferase-like isoform X2 n=1 Tax=Lethenteron reissneri TaxID=7753 RepID=UPI002AB683B8|nr:thialysine N-epsilon-acetyltransferase-like isoform X2 [Lethenteron reissneri]